MDTPAERQRQEHRMRLAAPEAFVAQKIEAERREKARWEAYNLAEAERREHEKRVHTQMLKAARVFESLRQERQAHITPSRPAPERRHQRRARPMARPAPVARVLGTAGNATARAGLLQGLAATSTQGLETLIRAWQEASLPTRQAFRQWVNDQSLTGVARVSTSAQTQRYAAEIARICSVDAASVS